MKICAMDATMELGMIKAIRASHINFAPGSNELQHLSPIVANTKNLRLIYWKGGFAYHLLSNFIQFKLRCLILEENYLQKQLWEGYKWLPNLKTMELWRVQHLIITPNFDGFPNLEIFVLSGCEYLKEIHPFIGRLERLVSLTIQFCYSLEMCPPITQPKKLETLCFKYCPKLFNILEIQQQNTYTLGHLHLDNIRATVASSIDSFTNSIVTWLTSCCSNHLRVECCLEERVPRNNMKPCFGLPIFFEDLRDLNLGGCSLGDEEIGSAEWELPNLEKLDLSNNEFSRLNFSSLRLPRLRFLNVESCSRLVELSELPSNIAAVDAGRCGSLESFGDISKCKWLWKVSNWLGNYDIGERLLDSILQGNAIEGYFISVTLMHQIPNKFVGRLFFGRTFTLRLPDNCYNDFCRFLICLVTGFEATHISIVIKQEVDEEDSLFELSHGSNEAVEPECVYETQTLVGYVSFGSLRHTAFSNSSNTTTSLSIDCKYEDWVVGKPSSYIGAELVLRKSKGDHEVQTTKVTTDSSEFWDDERYGQPTFRIEHDSKSSIKIVWHLQ